MISVWLCVVTGLFPSIVTVAAREVDLSFPVTVAGFSRGPSTDYEVQSPGLGYSLRYNGRGWKADVYVYDAGIKSIPDGPSSPATVRQIEQAAGDIQTARQQGLYREAVEGGSLRLRAKGAERLACRTFDLVSRDGTRLDSILCLTGSHGKFVKFRLSGSRGARRADAERFLAGWLPRL